jgi:rod shape-determining protein MreC
MRTKILLVLFGLGIIIFLNLFQNEVKNFFYSLSSPFQKVLFGAGDYISDFLGTLSEMKNQKKENEELKRKIQALRAENVKLKAFEEENKILREALKIKPQKPFELFLSHLISKDIISPDSILIKGGLKDGIEKGMVVITPEYVLIGKIERVYDNFSQVSLISRKDFSFDAKVLRDQNSMPISLNIPEEAEIYGIVKGKGNQQIYLDKVLLDAKIEEKNILITATLGGVFPEGLLVGEIIKVRKSDLEPFQIAEVSPFFNIKKLKTLFIITKW